MRVEIRVLLICVMFCSIMKDSILFSFAVKPGRFIIKVERSQLTV